MIRYLMLFLALFATPALGGPKKPLRPNTVITNVESLTSYRYIDANAEASGLRMDGFKIEYGRAGIRIRSDANDIVIRNGTLANRGVTKGGDLPVGIDLAGTVHNVLIENVTSSNNKMVVVAGKYTNGDGFSQEQLVSGIIYRNAVALNNSDGGFDLKGRAHLENLTAERNGRNYRFWNDITATTLTSKDPSGAHVWLNAKGPQTTVIDRLVVSSTTTAPVLRIENKFAVEFEVKECVIAVPAGTLLQWGGKAAKVKWGKNCLADAKGYAVNTPVVEEGFDAGEVLPDVDGDKLIVLKTAATIKRVNAASGQSLKAGDTLQSLGGTRYKLLPRM